MSTRSRADVLGSLTALTNNLAGQRTELADLLSAELEGRLSTWMNADENTLKGRDRIADFNVMNLSMDIIQLKGEIAANEDRRILFLEELHYAPVVAS